MLDKDILFIQNNIKNKKITENDLINEAKEKIYKINDKINAFNLIIENPEFKDSTSPLAKIPYALKDNISTKGIRTTACSNTLKNYVPIFNATVYEKLQNAGAILIGKTTCDELAMGGTGTTGNSGKQHNPWDIKRMCGGSSSGSAAAVASGIVPFAIGSDTGDSIRKPAALCGIVGYKPSYGLISRYGLFAFASSLDHVGVFTRNVKDAAIVVNEIKGYDEKDMTSIKDMDNINLTEDIDKNVSGKKLFYIKEICDKKEYTNKNTCKILDEFNKTIENCRKLGMEVYEESIDINLLNAIKPIYDCLSCAEATSNDSNLTGIVFGPRNDANKINDMMLLHRTNGFSSLIKRRFVIGSYVLQKENQEKYYLNAKRVRRLIVDKINELFKKYDGLIMPCSGDIAPLLDKASDKITKNEVILENHLAIGNFGGFPSITIPNGFIDNMPIGINITGKFKDDKNILNIANEIEKTMSYSNICVKEVK